MGGLTIAAPDGVDGRYVLASIGHAAGELGVRPLVDRIATDVIRMRYYCQGSVLWGANTWIIQSYGRFSQ